MLSLEDALRTHSETYASVLRELLDMTKMIRQTVLEFVPPEDYTSEKVHVFDQGNFCYTIDTISSYNLRVEPFIYVYGKSPWRCKKYQITELYVDRRAVTFRTPLSESMANYTMNQPSEASLLDVRRCGNYNGALAQCQFFNKKLPIRPPMSREIYDREQSIDALLEEAERYYNELMFRPPGTGGLMYEASRENFERMANNSAGCDVHHDAHHDTHEVCGLAAPE